MTRELSSVRWTEPDSRLTTKWIDERDRMDRVLAPFGKRMLERAALVPGENVIDIGCGTGATTLEAWTRVAPSGSVTGIDVSEAMLAAAGQRAHQLDNANIGFVQADAETYRFEPRAFDAAISRFSLAHFADTSAGLANIQRALRPGGRLVFCDWTARADNEWMSLADDVARRVVPELFAHVGRAHEHADDFAVESRLRALLRDAGFVIEALDRDRDDLWIGKDPADVLAWFARLPEGRILEELGASQRQRLLDALRNEFERRTRADGVYLAATAWMVDCRVPHAGQKQKVLP